MSDSDLERILNQFRQELLRKERAAASQMVRAYGKAWQRIQEELQRLDAEYEAIKAIGGRPSWEWIYEHNRLKAFRAQVERELLQFAEYAERTIRAEQQEAIEAAGQQAQRVVKAMLGVETGWNAFDTGAIETMVGLTRPDSPLHQLLLSISGERAQAAEDALLEGMLLGQNPRAVAGVLKSVLGLGLSRALTIARTETLRAHREATRASYQANNDLVGGWIWHSAADERTCGCCWAMHGTVHKLEEELNGHPNCRCGMVPVLPGINFKVKPGTELFAGLNAEQQIHILGPAKWAAWKDGRFKLSDLVGARKSSIWGSMRVERSLAGLLGASDAKQYTRLALMGLAKEKLSVDDLIRVAGLGLRDLTPVELERVIRQVAAAGFDPNELERAGGRLAGVVWEGQVLNSSSKIPPGVAHYLRHVVYGQEWPSSTTLTEYYQSLEDVIRDSKSRILISKFGDEWQIGFLRENQPGTQYTYIWVDYRVSTHHWVTGFMTNDFDEVLNNPRRIEKRWVR